MVVLAVLQAPVSDREAAPESGVGPEVVAEARALVDAGKGGAIISHALYGFIPLSAQRALDLFERLGADDMFSSDMTEVELSSRLGHLGDGGAHVHIALSMADQYVPLLKDNGVEAYAALGARLLAGMGGNRAAATLQLIEGADHALSGATAGQAFVAKVVELLEVVASSSSRT